MYAHARACAHGGADGRWRAGPRAIARAKHLLTFAQKYAKIAFLLVMAGKFTPEDLFRIAEANLTEVDFVRFRFICETAQFRKILANIAGTEADVTRDERNLLERVIRRLGLKGGILVGGR